MAWIESYPLKFPPKRHAPEPAGKNWFQRFHVSWVIWVFDPTDHTDSGLDCILGDKRTMGGKKEQVNEE